MIIQENLNRYRFEKFNFELDLRVAYQIEFLDRKIDLMHYPAEIKIKRLGQNMNIKSQRHGSASKKSLTKIKVLPFVIFIKNMMKHLT